MEANHASQHSSSRRASTKIPKVPRLKVTELESVNFVPFDPEITPQRPSAASIKPANTRHTQQAWYHGAVDHVVLQRNLRLCLSLRAVQREFLTKSKILPFIGCILSIPGITMWRRWRYDAMLLRSQLCNIYAIVMLGQIFLFIELPKENV